MQDKQMEFMFMAEGGEVDPVSGNEIPPGGTAEGVRDDVDAKLSEGEYVIPANVVRFYGIDKFEKMITKAEETLAEMEAKGRMGNPEPEEDDLPFADEELQTTEGPELKMAEGGPVYSQTPSTGMFESVPYINAKGERKIILMYNGRPINGIIPEGFFPDTPENRKSLNPTEETSAPETTTGDSDTDNNPDAANPQNLDVTEWAVDDFENMMKQQSTTEMLSRGFGLAGPAGLILSTAINKGNEMTLNRAAEEIANRLQNPETPQEDKDRLAKVYEQMQKQQEKGGMGIIDGVVGGKGILGGLFGDEGLLGGMFKSSRTESKPSAPTTTRTRSTAPTSDSHGPTPNRAPSVSPRPASRPSSTPTKGVSTQAERSSGDYSRGGGSGTGVSQSTRDANRDAGGYTGGGRSGGFKKGGLVTRRKKK